MEFKRWFEAVREDPFAGLWITTRIDVANQKANQIAQWFDSQYGKMGYRIKFNPLGYADQHRAVLYIPNKYAEDPGYPQVPELIDNINLRFAL